ncbi:MAG: PIG-L family deacetylase, partial [Steroidobacteraceae bacterium]
AMLSLVLALLPAVAGAAQPPMEAPRAGERILVVSPHPDDETLCCAGYIQQAVRAGAQVSIAWLTAGDGFELDALLVEHHLRLKGLGMRRLGAQRMDEARAAGERMAVPAANMYLLGYPDRGLGALLAANQASPWRSPYTETSAIPYLRVLAPGAPYTGASLERDFATVLAAAQPTLILVSAPEELHPDHAAAPRLVERVLAARGLHIPVRYYLIHAGRDWPAPRGLHPELELTPPPTAATRTWQSFELTPELREGKRITLEAHRSQLEIMRPFLDSFVRRNELFAQ